MMGKGTFEYNMEMDELKIVSSQFVYAALKLRDYGYSTEEVYEIIELLFGREFYPDKMRKERLDGILDSIYEESGKSDAIDFMTCLNRMLDGKDE